ncbi:hypothetical protein GQ53DRAFT_330096 [Thozetella sp. PMI_491]|nr:hypothetical protein GQ53DRAFT_330096 [Thozetella sp. PMI_491]
MPAKRLRDCQREEGCNSEPEDGELGIRFSAAWIMEKLREKLRESWPEEYKECVRCPFSAKDPKRYDMVKDNACTEWGFKDIADLKDHIKRKHSFKYGCEKCGKRFHGRDRDLVKLSQKHEKECTLRTSQAVYTPSYLEPEVMNPEQDKVLDVDFRKSEFRGLKNNMEEQYWVLCQKIWPDIQRGDFVICKPPCMFHIAPLPCSGTCFASGLV